MRVLHLDSGRVLRGGQRQVLLLMRELAALGVEQTLLARGELLSAARAGGFDARPFSLPALVRAARRSTVVHAHDGRTHGLAALLAPGRPVIAARRVAFPPRPGPWTRWKYGRAVTIAVSEAVAAELRRAGVDAARIRIIPDGVDLPAGASALDGPPVALSLEDPGKGGALVAQLPARVVRSTDLARDLPHARVFIYLSDSEGLGSAALLAMAHGVPVIASRRGGLPEAVLDGETGILVENTAEDVLKALETLESDSRLAAALGAAGRLRAAREFAPAAAAARTLAVYREAGA